MKSPGFGVVRWGFGGVRAGCMRVGGFLGKGVGCWVLGVKDNLQGGGARLQKSPRAQSAPGRKGLRTQKTARVGLGGLGQDTKNRPGGAGEAGPEHKKSAGAGAGEAGPEHKKSAGGRGGGGGLGQGTKKRRWAGAGEAGSGLKKSAGAGGRRGSGSGHKRSGWFLWLGAQKAPACYHKPGPFLNLVLATTYFPTI